MIIGISGKIGSGKDTVGKIIQYFTDKSNMGYSHPDGFNDYIAWLDNNHNSKSNWQIKKFAYKLKQCVSIILGIPVEDLEKMEVKNRMLGEEWIRYARAEGFFQHNGNTTMNSVGCTKEEYEEELKVNWQTAYKLEHTPRTILQMMGTEVGRHIHPNFWVNALMSDHKQIAHNWDSDGNTTVQSNPNWIITDTRFPNEAKAIKDRKGIVIRVERYLKTQDHLIKLRGGGQAGMTNLHPSETALDDYNFDYTIDNNGTIEELIEKVKQILIKEKVL